MKLVTYVPTGAARISEGNAGILHGETVLDLAALGAWAAQQGVALPERGLPTTTLDLLRLGPEGMAAAREALALAERARAEDLAEMVGLAYPRQAVTLRTPIPNPPSARDFYAFEQHVKAARARRGARDDPRMV